MSVVLILKLVLVPTLIGCITLVGRRWGPAVAGWLSAFPVVAGPILFFIALEQGVPFAATAVTSTFSAVLAALAFVLSYAWSATRYSWVVSLVIGLSSFLFLVFVLNSFAPSLAFAIPAVLAALLVAPRLYPSIALPSLAPSPPSRDMLLRMVAGAALVLLVTHFSSGFGARLSGLLAMFPVMTSVLAVFTHRQSGGAFAIYLLRGLLFGFWAFIGFCLVLVLMLPSFGIAYSFLAAIGVAVATQAVTRSYLRRYLASGSAGPAREAA